MDFKTELSQRLNMGDINEIVRLLRGDDKRKQELYDLIIEKDEKIGFHAAYIFSHCSPEDNRWLYNKQDELIDNLLTCKHGGRRRLILRLLYSQPLMNPPRVDFLDYCLERIVSDKELPGVQSLCIKLAYELCRPTPELVQELKTILEMMDESSLVPAIRSIRKKVLNAIPKGSRLQKI